MTNLTVREAAQAILDGKALEYKCPITGAWVLDEVPIMTVSVHNLNIPTNYRLATETITVNGVKVPKPESKPLAKGKRYYIAILHYTEFCGIYTWGDDAGDRIYLSRGLIHLTEEAAVAHAKAMLEVTE